jgi:hypothetical protein
MKENFDHCQKLDDEIEAKLIAQKKDTDNELDTASDVRTQNRYKLKKRIECCQIKPTPEPATPSEKSSEKKTAQLPTLKLPTFDGTFTKWNAFWDAINADVGTLTFPSLITLSDSCLCIIIYAMAGKSASLLIRRTPVKLAV